MTCNCKTTFTEKLLNRAKELFPDSTDHSVEIENYAFVFNKHDNGMTQKGFMPAVIEHKVIIKKTGLPKVKKEKTSLLFSYCPFCGVDLKEPEPEESPNESKA